MLSFNPAGSMLFMGTCQNEDIFLAMAPNDILQRHTKLPPSGHTSASPLMFKCHYYQMVIMMAHFLTYLPLQAYNNMRPVYELYLDSIKLNFKNITNTLYVFHPISLFAFSFYFPYFPSCLDILTYTVHLQFIYCTYYLFNTCHIYMYLFICRPFHP